MLHADANEGRYLELIYTSFACQSLSLSLFLSFSLLASPSFPAGLNGYQDHRHDGCYYFWIEMPGCRDAGMLVAVEYSRLGGGLQR